MISLAVLFLVLSSGGILGAVRWKYSFEEVLPVTCMLSALLLFFFGLADALPLGVYFILIASGGIYLYCGIRFFRTSDKELRKSMLSRILTMGAFGFTFSYASAVYINIGRLTINWDEFSHWATVVKQMFFLDDLATGENAVFVSYKYYPPIMALFQYLSEKLMALFKKGAEFSDWRLYFAYQVFSLSFLIPFLRKFKRGKISSYAAMLAVLLSPMVLFSTVYSSIYIDPLLGIVSGAGLAAVFTEKRHDALYEIKLSCMIMTLVLAKSAGLLFAFFLAAAFALTEIIHFRGKRKKQLASALVALISVALPKLLWSLELAKNNVIDDAGVGISWPSLLAVLSGRENSYRMDVLQNFWKEFCTGSCVTVLGISVSPLAFCIAACVIFSWFCIKNKGKKIVVPLVLLIQTAIYVIGLCLTYMYHFVPYEAVNLASFDRYLAIGLSAVFLFLVLAGLQSCLKMPLQQAVLLFAILSLCPLNTVKEHITRQTVQQSYDDRSIYNTFCERLQEQTEENSTIYFIQQEGHGYGYWVCQYIAMPRMLNPENTTANHTWSLGTELYEGDLWSCEISAEEWQQKLKETCDYVALFQIDDYFLENYASVFEIPEDIDEERLYCVSKETGKLSLVGRL